MTNISAIIVVKENPSHIFETINSIKTLVKEILIADIGIDTTLLKELRKNKLIRIISIHEHVPYVELIREQLKTEAKHEYILFLDPDEIISSTLLALLKEKIGTYDYYSIPRKNILFNKWIEHARWWPDYQVRLFKKDKVTWPKKIHHQPIVNGSGYSIEAKEENALIHYNYKNIDEYLMKALRYAKSEAHELSQQEKVFALPDAINRSLTEFMSRFFYGEGYKDGMHGFTLAFLQMLYSFLVFFYYWEEKKYFPVRQEELIDNSFLYFKKGSSESMHWIEKIKSLPFFLKLKLKILKKNLNSIKLY